MAVKKTPAARKTIAAKPAKTTPSKSRSSASKVQIPDEKFYYFFGPGKADGDAGMKDLLGGKGANLAEMAGAGIPVPPGFTMTTTVCKLYYESGMEVPKPIDKELEKHIALIEHAIVKIRRVV